MAMAADFWARVIGGLGMIGSMENLQCPNPILGEETRARSQTQSVTRVRLEFPSGFSDASFSHRHTRVVSAIVWACGLPGSVAAVASAANCSGRIAVRS